MIIVNYFEKNFHDIFVRVNSSFPDKTSMFLKPIN